MLFGSSIGGIPGLVPPEVLIFFHIPKTGGMTMKGVVEHCFADQHFNAYLKYGGTALHVRSTAKVAEEFHKLPVENLHFAMDIDTLFDRPSKCFTILRHPANRVISNFFSIG
jgi:sulfotransferase famil protein